MPFVPDAILIEEACQGSEVAARAKRIAPRASVEVFGDLGVLLRRMEMLPAEVAKRNLVIARRAGGFVKEFPAGPGITRSGWHYFIPAIGCPADCRYCFLETYHPVHVPVVFDGLDRMLAEVEAKARENGGGYFYGGELCDNLMLEPFSEVVAPLVELFRGLPNATLELRTKSAQVAHLVAAGASPNVVVSWTFTPDDVAMEFEKGTASLEERLASADAVRRAGFSVGVRMDPIVLSSDWRRSYMRLVSALSVHLDASGVDSVHLGCMRYTPALKAAAEARFGRGGPFAGEFAAGPDGKLRYPRPVRVAAYVEIARMIREWDERIPVRLCMETPAVTADFERISGDFAAT